MSTANLSVTIFIALHLISSLSWAVFTAGVPVTSSQINALRNSINTKLSSCSAPNFTFTDHPAAPGLSVKASHLIELRAAITNLYTSQGFAVPSFTDPVITPKVSSVKAVHFSELQAMVTAASCAAPLDCPATILSWTQAGRSCSSSVGLTTSGSSVNLTDGVVDPNVGKASFSCASGAWSLPTAIRCDGCAGAGFKNKLCCTAPYPGGNIFGSPAICCALDMAGNPITPTWFKPMNGVGGPSTPVNIDTNVSSGGYSSGGTCGCGNSPVWYAGVPTC